MSHSEIIERLKKYCLALPKGHPMRLHFLYFFTSFVTGYIDLGEVLGPENDLKFLINAVIELLEHTKV